MPDRPPKPARGAADAESVRDLKSLGPKSQAMLARAGITTVAELRRLGAVAAYARAKRANSGASLNLLWALESALTGEPWQEVARRHRTSLLLALDDHERSN
jgi:DNA transformation protein